MELIPLLQQSDLERLGVHHVGERIMLLNLAKGNESKHESVVEQVMIIFSI